MASEKAACRTTSAILDGAPALWALNFETLFGCGAGVKRQLPAQPDILLLLHQMQLLRMITVVKSVRNLPELVRNPLHHVPERGVKTASMAKQLQNTSRSKLKVDDYGDIQEAPGLPPTRHGPVVYYRSPRRPNFRRPPGRHPRVKPPPSQEASLPVSKSLDQARSTETKMRPLPPITP